VPTVLEQLNETLCDVMAKDDRVILLGMDLNDPIGGAFRVTKGLSTAYPDRVISTPISESLIIGAATGLALKGFRPVAEIMFGDFMTLTFDQLLNGCCKFPAMYDPGMKLPVLIRTPMGGGRGYGSTHSQSLEKHFLGVPGLDVVAVSPFHDNATMLRTIIEAGQKPTLFIEHKLLYGEERFIGNDIWRVENPSADPFDAIRVMFRHTSEVHATLVAYGAMANLCLQAATTLAVENEVFCELIVLARLSPFCSNLSALLRSEATAPLVAVEEGTPGAGITSEVLALAAEQDIRRRCFRRVTAENTAIPCARHLERKVLPSVETVIAAVLSTQ